MPIFVCTRKGASKPAGSPAVRFALTAAPRCAVEELLRGRTSCTDCSLSISQYFYVQTRSPVCASRVVWSGQAWDLCGTAVSVAAWGHRYRRSLEGRFMRRHLMAVGEVREPRQPCISGLGDSLVSRPRRCLEELSESAVGRSSSAEQDGRGMRSKVGDMNHCFGVPG